MSKYEYTTVTGLQDFNATIYSGVFSGYTSGIVNRNISNAERMVNAYMGGTTFGSGSNTPDAIKVSTDIIATQMMENRMIEDGFLDNQSLDTNYYTDTVKMILDPIKQESGSVREIWIEEW